MLELHHSPPPPPVAQKFVRPVPVTNVIPPEQPQALEFHQHSFPQPPAPTVIEYVVPGVTGIVLSEYPPADPAMPTEQLQQQFGDPAPPPPQISNVAQVVADGTTHV
jgi:hypothetical protein